MSGQKHFFFWSWKNLPPKPTSNKFRIQCEPHLIKLALLYFTFCILCILYGHFRSSTIMMKQARYCDQFRSLSKMLSYELTSTNTISFKPQISVYIVHRLIPWFCGKRLTNWCFFSSCRPWKLHYNKLETKTVIRKKKYIFWYCHPW